jgi:murein endopeptidase
MTKENMLDELKEVCVQLGYRLRFENGDFQGGACILRDEKMLVVNKRLPTERKVYLIASALQEIGVDEVFLKPAIRKLMDAEDVKRG